ncbi:MAG: hypothetical protein U0165_13640 [Polyangiaceae bacterium]
MYRAYIPNPPAVDAAEPTTPSEPTLRPRAAGIALSVAGFSAVYAGLGTIARDGSWAERLTSVAPSTLVAAGALLVTSLAARALFSRKPSASIATLLLATAVGTGVGAKGALNRWDASVAQQKEESAQLAVLSDRLEEILRHDLRELGHVDSSAAEVSSLMSSIEQLRPAVHGEVAQIAAARVGLAHDLDGASRHLREAKERLEGASVLDARGVRSPEELDRRLELIDDFTKANEEMTAFLKLVPEAYDSQLRRAGLSESARAKQVAKLRETYEPVRALAIRESDEDIVAGMREVVELLRDEWGLWRWNADAVALEIDDEDTLERYGDLLSEIDTARLEQEQLRASRGPLAAASDEH